MTSGAGAIAAETARLIGIGKRAYVHQHSETTLNVDEVMSTVTPVEQLTWTRNLCWAVPDSVERRVSTATDPASVRDYYVKVREHKVVPQGSINLPVTDIRSDWYVFHEFRSTVLRDPRTDETFLSDVAVLFMMDGHEGIASEIGCGRSERVQLEPERWREIQAKYLAAVGSGDADAVLSLMSDDVQGAVRAYYGYGEDKHFIQIDDRAAMHYYYRSLFESAQIVDVNIVNAALREWFMFLDLQFELRMRDRAGSASTVQLRTVEVMPVDTAGMITGRFGYGTEPW